MTYLKNMIAYINTIYDECIRYNIIEIINEDEICKVLSHKEIHKESIEYVENIAKQINEISRIYYESYNYAKLNDNIEQSFDEFVFNCKTYTHLYNRYIKVKYIRYLRKKKLERIIC